MARRECRQHDLREARQGRARPGLHDRPTDGRGRGAQRRHEPDALDHERHRCDAEPGHDCRQLGDQLRWQADACRLGGRVPDAARPCLDPAGRPDRQPHRGEGRCQRRREDRDLRGSARREGLQRPDGPPVQPRPYAAPDELDCADRCVERLGLQPGACGGRGSSDAGLRAVAGPRPFAGRTGDQAGESVQARRCLSRPGAGRYPAEGDGWLHLRA